MAPCLHGTEETWEWAIELLLPGSGVSAWNCHDETGENEQREKKSGKTRKQINKNIFPLKMELQNKITKHIKKGNKLTTEHELT